MAAIASSHNESRRASRHAMSAATPGDSCPRTRTRFFLLERREHSAVNDVECRMQLRQAPNGAVALAVHGATVAEGKLPKTIPIQVPLGEGLDIGQDVG